MEAEFYQAGHSNESFLSSEFVNFLTSPLCSFRFLDAAQCRYHRLNAPESKWHPSRSWPRCHSIVMASKTTTVPRIVKRIELFWISANCISIIRVCEVPEIAGANKGAAFDGSTASAYLMEAWRTAIPKHWDGIIPWSPELCWRQVPNILKQRHSSEDTQFDAWIGIDVGIGNQERFHDIWEPGKASSVFCWTMFLLWNLVDAVHTDPYHPQKNFCLWICLSNWHLYRSFRAMCFREWLLAGQHWPAWAPRQSNAVPQEAILRVRAFWESGCVPSKARCLSHSFS